VEAALSSLLATQSVQGLAMVLFGTQEMPPVTLLSILLGLLLSYIIFLIVIPKGRVALWGFWYFLVSGDNKTRKPDDDPFQMDSPGCKRMKVIFIRHGESDWNAVFNVGSKALLPIRLAQGLIREAFMVFDQDSLFIDSPLSDIGIQQAWDLMTFLAAQPAGTADPSRPCKELEIADLVSIIRGDVGESILVSSILRRAISTGLIALSPRLLKTSPQKDKMILMTSLQEISRNVDTLSLTPARQLPQCPSKEADMKNMGDLMTHFYRTRVDRKHNEGNKTLKQKAIRRQEQFNKWVFDQKADTIIVAGHSIWFREYFKSFLPKVSKHVAKTSKIANGGVIAFDLYKDSKSVLRIDQQSIKEVYGGFEVKGKHKKA